MEQDTEKTIKIVSGIIIASAVAFAGYLYVNRRRGGSSPVFVTKILDYAFSKEQEHFIKDLHPQAQQKFRDFIADVERTLGYRVIITSGYRTFQEQKKQKADNSSNASAGFSMHNYGMSLDINLEKGGKLLRKSSPKKEWEDSGVVAIAKKHNLYWGGGFGGYYDPVHFDMRNFYDINTLYATAIKQFGSADAAQGNRLALAA